MQVIIKGDFSYTAEFLIKEEVYAKLLSAAKEFGKDNAVAMLGHYVEDYMHNLDTITTDDKNIYKMLKESMLSFRTFFPSNHVTISVYGNDESKVDTISVYGNESKVDIDPNLKKYRERYQEIADLLARGFKHKTDILEFISGELYCNDIINKEEE